MEAISDPYDESRNLKNMETLKAETTNSTYFYHEFLIKSYSEPRIEAAVTKVEIKKI